MHAVSLKASADRVGVVNLGYIALIFVDRSLKDKKYNMCRLLQKFRFLN